MSNSGVPTTESRSLRYDFTASEIHDFSLRLANKTKELSAKTEEKKSVMTQWNATLEGIKSEQTRLSNFIADGFEYRSVDCKIEYNKPSVGRKTLTRSDNNYAWDEKMESWEHNLFTQVTDDDMLESDLDTKPSKPKSKRKRKMDDIQDAIETEDYTDI